MTSLPRFAPGAVFAGDFVVERRLAEGGMGAVYVVEQRSTGHRRALKVMHPDIVADARNRERFPHANVITRALGMCTKAGPDVSAASLRPGDVFLLCTDGLIETLDEGRIRDVLASTDPEAACEDLVTEAFERGARDNITAVVLRVCG